MVRAAREAEQRNPHHPIALALDTKGPEIRTGNMKQGISEVRVRVRVYVYMGGWVPVGRHLIDILPILFTFLSHSLALPSHEPSHSPPLSPPPQINLIEGATLTVTVDETKRNECDEHLLFVDYSRLPQVRGKGKGVCCVSAV